MLDGLTSGLIEWLIGIIELLPESPFAVLDTVQDSTIYELLGFVNWFIPFGVMITITETWLVGVALYHIYQIVLRWLKVVQ